MSVANAALVYNLGLAEFFLNDGLVAGAAGARATATRLPGQVNRFTSAPANGAAILPAIVSGEGSRLVFVINDSAQAILVGATAGETVGGVATTANYSAGTLSIPAGQSGIFVPVPNSHGGTLDWRGAVIP